MYYSFSFINTMQVSVLALPIPDLSSPVSLGSERHSVVLPIVKRQRILEKRDGGVSGSIGTGDLDDLYYTVSIQIGTTTTALSLDTGSSDLWVMSDNCETDVCKSSKATPYASSSGQSTSASVQLNYGDSTTGTHANGPIMKDTVSFAGLAMANQTFAAINDTNNLAVVSGGAGIFGLGFPTESFVQYALVDQNNPTHSSNVFVENMDTDGPLVARLAMTGQLKHPMFSISLQRDAIDAGGNNGSVTIGDFPVGVDNSSFTWVSVRLYSHEDGGLSTPTFAPNEIYPLRWEVPLDGVFLDGDRLPDTNLTGVNKGLTALIDTGNSILRGPSDVVNNVLSQVSPAFSANNQADPIYPCSTPHTLAFQFGGKQFLVDPRDFVSQNKAGDANNCLADNIVPTDPPQTGTLFSWSLGDTFFKSNIVAFYYGNLTHPSVDPPRIGFLSTVPSNADDQLKSAVKKAQDNKGQFHSKVDVAPTPTGSLLNVSPTSISFMPPMSTGIVQNIANGPSSDSRLHTDRARYCTSFDMVTHPRPTGAKDSRRSLS
ncbi:peptidase A1 family protein [Abortiporus biennis]